MAPPQVELGGMMWQKIWTDSDWTIIICTLLLVGIGLTAIGSATHVNQEAIGFGSLVVKTASILFSQCSCCYRHAIY